MTKDEILKLDSKKHVKIWLLHKLGMSRKEIAEALGTNSGHVGNEIKAYEKDGLKQAAAEKLNKKLPFDAIILNAAKSALDSIPETDDDGCTLECDNISDEIKSNLLKSGIESVLIDVTNSKRKR
ncbi:MAG: helix-turn-helix domain-containing protein, partial [Nanoarchaeota archaeon]